MDRIWILVCLAAGGFTQESSRAPLYVISAPELLHGGMETPLAVTVLVNSLVKVIAEATNGNVKVSQTQEVQGGLTRLLTLPPIPVPQSAPFNLTVKCYRMDTLLFTNTSSIGFNSRTVSSSIQMERSHYEPGDTVKVRVVSTLLDNLPYKGNVDIAVWDPSGNVVERWESTGNLGMVLHGFSLSLLAPVGQWTLTATVDGESEEKTFTVGPYERPHFKLLIRSPSHVQPGDGLSGSVRALYPSGQPVHGTLSVSAVLDLNVSSDASPVRLTQTTEIYGSTHFSFSADQLQALPVSSPFVYITATVTDSSTGSHLHVNKTVQIQRVQTAYQLSFHSYPSRLKPTLHFYTNLSIGRYDRQPLSPLDVMNPVTVHVTQIGSPMETEEPTRLTLNLPKDGNLNLTFKIQPDVKLLIIQARFQSSVETLEIYSDHSSPSGSYIQILPVHNVPACIGMPFRLDVESNFQITKLHFVVSSKGRVLTAGTKNSPSLSLTPSLSWSPSACVTFYCNLPNGDVSSDTACLPISPQCNVTLQWSRARAQPGEKVSLQVSGLASRSRVEVAVMGTQEEVLEPNLDFKVKQKQESNLKVLTNTGLVRRGGSEAPGNDQALMVQTYWSHWSESLLWLHADVSEEAWSSEDMTVPDGFTSLSALTLVMSENQGLLFNRAPQKLSISKDFSLSLDVPSQLIRGEEIVLDVHVINHLEQTVDVIVLLAKSASYEFVLTNRNNESIINAQKLSLGSHQSGSALFPIRTLALGGMEILVDGVSSDATCSLSRTVMVEPEGVPQSFSQTLFLELEPGKERGSGSVSFSFPPDVVADSQRANMVLVGDILALPFNNLDRLEEMPLGFSESNMVHFSSSVSVLQYLNKTNNDNQGIRRKALSYMIKAYQKQRSYQLQDGSFSAFGSSDPSGSTWLSAFVLRCFHQAKFFMPIDQNVLDKTRTWLLKNQKVGGEFTEAGRLMHTEMQEGLDGGPVALTAYVLVALLEDGGYECTGKTEQGVTKPDSIILAQKYLEKQMFVGVVSNYSLCLTAYALALADSPWADVALAELNRRADLKDNVMMWTSSSGLKSHDKQPGSVQVEMASYVLLALLRQGGFVEGIALMKWLSMQITHPRGYWNSQATAVGLQALVCYAVYSGADTINLRFNISAPTSPTVSVLSINSSNYQQYQSREISAKKDILLDIRMEGKGFAIFQLNVFYHRRSEAFSQSLHPTTDSDAFSLAAEVTGADDPGPVLSICTRLKDSQALAQTGMVRLHVGMLSGFTLAPEAATSTGLIRKVETAPNAALLYLDSLTKSEVCIRLPIIRQYNVAHVRDAVVQVYDYYEPKRRASALYNSPVLRSTDTCFFCGANCERCWPRITIAVSRSDMLSPRCDTAFISCLIFGLLMLLAALR